MYLSLSSSHSPRLNIKHFCPILSTNALLLNAQQINSIKSQVNIKRYLDFFTKKADPSSYESQSMEIELYFPTHLAEAISEEVKKRKQSIYVEELSAKGSQDHRIRQWSETQEEGGGNGTGGGGCGLNDRTGGGSNGGGFRLRSGTDISNSVLSARNKFRRSVSCQEPGGGLKIREGGSLASLKKVVSVVDKAQDDVEEENRKPENRLGQPKVDVADESNSKLEVFVDCSSRKSSEMVRFESVESMPDTDKQQDVEEDFQDCLSRKASSLDFGTCQQHNQTFQLDLDSLVAIEHAPTDTFNEESSDNNTSLYAPEKMSPMEMYTFF